MQQDRRDSKLTGPLFSDSESESSPVELSTTLRPVFGLACQPDAVAAFQASKKAVVPAAEVEELEASSETSSEEEDADSPVALAGEAATEACVEAARGMLFKPYAMCKARRALDELAHAQNDEDPRRLEDSGFDGG